MTLFLNILRKDLRHFYPELLINLALLGAFAWTAPFSWPNELGSKNSPLFPIILRLLLPLGWLFLISRVVHDEALPGDRQFWITRPYPWPTLLVEKLTVIVLCIHVPLSLMQVYLLHHAGFPLGPALGGLLHAQVLTAAVFTLPFTALAVVTATFGRHLLALLGGFLYLIALSSLVSWFLGPRMFAPYLGGAVVLLATLGLCATVLAMYARRPTLRARVALVCAPLVFALLSVVAPVNLLVHQAYASTGTGDHLAFNLDGKYTQPGQGAPLLLDRKDILLELPVSLRGVHADSAATVEAARLTLATADGTHWQSPFLATSAELGSQATAFLNLRVPFVVYRRFSDRPTTVSLEAAVTPFTKGSTRSDTLPPEGTAFTTEQGARCTVVRSNGVLVCRYAFRGPGPAESHFAVQDFPCNQPAPRHDERHSSTGSGTLLPDFDPVVFISTGLDRHSADPYAPPAPQFLCPGAFFSTTPEQPTAGERLLVTQPNVYLARYVQHRQQQSDAE